MKYKIDIQGMHCQGCKNLLQMLLEDENLNNVNVDYEKGFAEFESRESTEYLTALLDKVFAPLEAYKYSNLTIINQ